MAGKPYGGGKGHGSGSGGGGYTLSLVVTKGKQVRNSDDFVQPIEVEAKKGKHVMIGATIKIMEGTDVRDTGTTNSEGKYYWEYPGKISPEETQNVSLRVILIDLPETKEIPVTFEVRPQNEPKKETAKPKPSNISFEAVGEKGEYLLLIYVTDENGKGVKANVMIIEGTRELVVKPTNDNGQLLHSLHEFDTEKQRVEVRIDGVTPIKRAVKVLDGKPKAKPKPITVPANKCGKPASFGDKFRSIQQQLRNRKTQGR